MPLPLAHPAAVLPLIRWCPKHLHWPALVAGSLTPDVGYLFGLDEFGHTWAGTFVFCLPAGVVLTRLFYAVRQPLVTLLPPTHRQALQPFCASNHGAWGSLLISLLLGAWTHLVWDSFTHESGWLVLKLSFLRWSLASAGGHQLKLCRILWLLSSALGMILLSLKYSSWLKGKKGPCYPGAAKEWPHYAFWASLLLITAVAAAASSIKRLQAESGVHAYYEFIHDSLAAFFIISGLLLAFLGLVMRFWQSKRR